MPPAESRTGRQMMNFSIGVFCERQQDDPVPVMQAFYCRLRQDPFGMISVVISRCSCCIKAFLSVDIIDISERGWYRGFVRPTGKEFPSWRDFFIPPSQR